MTTVTQAGDDIATAEHEASEAEALVDALEARILDGDAAVGAEDLDRARSLAGFARLRIGTARRRVAQLEADRRAAALQALMPQMDALVATRAGRKGRAAKLAQDVSALVSAFRSELDAEANDTVALLRSLTDDACVEVEHAGEPKPQGRVYLDMGGRRLVVDGVPVLDRNELLGIGVDEIVNRALRGVLKVSP